MNIEERLEYLISKRTELQKSITELKKECISYKDSDSKNNNSEGHKKTEGMDSDQIYSSLKNSRNKFIKVKKFSGVVTLEANSNLNSHTYLQLSEMWSISDISDENNVSLKINCESDTEVRPLIVFYDRYKKKISHSFFIFNTPVRIELPDKTVYAGIEFRFERSYSVSIKDILFHVQTLEDLCEYNYLERINDKIEKIPVSNGGRYYIPFVEKFGLIADTFLFDSFKDTGNCIYITPYNYKDYIDELDFLMVASAWHGLNNEWDNMTNPDSETGIILMELIDCARQKNIPVVFYSKEDPPNYEYFVDIAKQCDYIFTSAAEMIPAYKRDCENEHVESLCFGINPVMHNPIGLRSTEKEDGVIFSGSWMTKYPDRITKLEMMFDGIIQSNVPLKIIDRNFEKKDARYYFPEKYYPYVSPAIEHDVLQKVHKLYNWAVNINSVTESTTMFANRVYELQAVGNLLFSNYSKGVYQKFDGVYIVNSKSDVSKILSEMTDEKIYYNQIRNVRRVMTGETTFDRLTQVINSIGISRKVTDRRVAVILNEQNERLEREFESQSYKNRIILNLDGCNEEKLKDVDIIAFWSTEFSYGEYYLEDMINAFKYTNCSYITKQSFIDLDGTIIEGKEHDYVNNYTSKFATIFWKSDYEMDNLFELKHKDVLENGYSTDHFELKLWRK